ncbi:hypothetical protein RJ55_00435 [Drechmeria coniospora]|nr:hypothetical protein RJ55_00435 [Drechmeria coniospora]
MLAAFIIVVTLAAGLDAAPSPHRHWHHSHHARHHDGIRPSSTAMRRRMVEEGSGAPYENGLPKANSPVPVRIRVLDEHPDIRAVVDNAMLPLVM